MGADTFALVTEHDVTRATSLEVAVPRARVLLRAAGRPLGFVAVNGPSVLTSGELVEAAGVQAELAAHLADHTWGRLGPWPGSGGLISVVLATRDRPAPLERALRSLLSCTGSFEVIVVDNAPTTDDSREVVKALGDDRVRYLRTEHPGLSRARNHGASLASGGVLAFTDDDVRVDVGWIDALERAFTLAPYTALVTGMVAADELETDAQVYFDGRVSWSTRCQPTELQLDGSRNDPLLPYRGGDLGTGANLAVRTRVFHALGGFDEALGVGTPSRGGEDLDLLARTLLGGWRVRYEPAALVWHTHRRELDDLQTQMRGYGSGLTAYLAKHALTTEGAQRLPRGLVRGARRVRSQQRSAPAAPVRAELLRAERRGLAEGPLLYRRGRRLRPAPEGSPDAEPSVPALELLADAPAPDAAAPLLVTAHGRPLGLLPLAAGDPRERGRELFAAEVALHEAETEPCGWEARLGAERPGVTVIITTIGDRPHGLEVIVDLLLQQRYAPLEVVVVDNRPGDWDSSAVPRPRVRLVSETVRGISAARNAGLAATTTPIVMFVDDDIIPSPDWAGWLVAALWSGSGAACATGLILPLETRTRGQLLLEEWGGFSKGFVPISHPLVESAHPLYPYLPGSFGSGANVGFRTDVLRELGGYDVVLGAGTPTHGGEDLVMQLGVVLSGRTLLYEPAAVVWHRHRASARAWGKQLFRYGVGLSAAMLRQASQSPAQRRAITKRLPAAARYALSPSSTKNEHRTGSYPRSFVLLELLGMAYGPLALRKSVRLHRKEQA